MRSSSPLSPSPSPQHSHLVSSHRTARRTYSKRAATSAQKRKAQAALPSSDIEGSDDDPQRSGKGKSTGVFKKRKHSLGQEERSSPSGRTAKWTVSLERKGAEEQEEVDAHLQQGRFERETLSESDQLVNHVPPTGCATSTRRTRKRSRIIEQADVQVENSNDTRSRRSPCSNRDIEKEDDHVSDASTELSSSTPAEQQPLKPPSTPPRASGITSRPLTPHSSPRDLSAMFTAVSPRKTPGRSRQADLEATGSSGGSVARSGRCARAGGLRRMLTKTQSLGGILKSPVNQHDASIINDGAVSPTRLLLPTSEPSTPSRYVGRTHSLPETPLKSPPNHAAPLIVANTMSQAQDDVGGKTKRTYGGSRTFFIQGNGKNADSEDGETEMASAAENNGILGKESYAELRKRYEVNNEEIEDEGHGSRDLMADLLLARAPQPVSDMRSRGENRRFMDEVGYLAEGIADPAASLSLKRATSLDLLDNMQEEDWFGKMEVCGQTERIWEAFIRARGAGDEVMDAICLLFLATLIRFGSGLDVILRLHTRGCMRILTELLKVRNGVLDERSAAKIANASRWQVQKVRQVNHSLRPLSSSCSSTRGTAASVLAAVCGDANWESIVPSLNAEKTLHVLLNSYLLDVRSLSERFDFYEKGLDLLPPEADVDLDYLHQCLVVISAILFNSSEDQKLSLKARVGLSEALVNTIVAGSALVLTLDDSRTQAASRCLNESLQVLANLVNSSDECGTTLSSFKGAITGLGRVMLRRHRISRTSEDRDGKRLRSTESGNDSIRRGQEAPRNDDEASPQDVTPEEILCVALAILTSSVLSDRNAADSIVTTKLDEGCSGLHACLRVCLCFDASPLPVHLVQLYLNLRDKINEATAGIMSGYLALLLSKLLTCAKSSYDLIIPYLPGSTRQEKLDSLLTSLNELSGLQSVLHRKLGEMASSDKETYPALAESEKLERDADVLECAKEELKSFIATIP